MAEPEVVEVERVQITDDGVDSVDYANKRYLAGAVFAVTQVQKSQDVHRQHG